MEKHDWIRRAEDLSARCARTGSLTHTGYLSPAERGKLEQWAGQRPGLRLLFHGGGRDCERTAAFFLPDWMEEESFRPGDYISALRLTAYFGHPGHRDVLGALLGMGVGREWLGDIRIVDDGAFVFCLNSVTEHLLGIEKAGRVSVRAQRLDPEQVPDPERRVKELSFSVQSLRLDAVAAGLFGVSRSETARLIAAGSLSVNYQVCLKGDRILKEGDVLSLRGKGKARITGTGGLSRKGRLFVSGEIYC